MCMSTARRELIVYFRTIEAMDREQRNLLGDVNKTSDGYSQAKDPCILTSSQTRVAAQKFSLQCKDASGIIAGNGALMRCLGSDAD